MKKIILSLLILFCSAIAFSQNMNPVKWTFSATKNPTSGKYTLYAKASIEKDWHVFATDPGGDGLLIGTQLVINPKLKLNNQSEVRMERKPITKDMEGIGMVNFFENDAVFMLDFDSTKPFKLTGTITYQCCNDKMCLPPTDLPFTVDIK